MTKPLQQVLPAEETVGLDRVDALPLSKSKAFLTHHCLHGELMFGVNVNASANQNLRGPRTIRCPCDNAAPAHGSRCVYDCVIDAVYEASRGSARTNHRHNRSCVE